MFEVGAATPKETRLSIRTTEQEKAILAEAARIRHKALLLHPYLRTMLPLVLSKDRGVIPYQLSLWHGLQ